MSGGTAARWSAWVTTKCNAKWATNWIVRRWRSVGTWAQTCSGATSRSAAATGRDMTTPPTRATPPTVCPSIIAGVRCGKASIRAQALHQLEHLLESAEFEEVCGRYRTIRPRCRRVVSQAHRDSCVRAVREADDKVRVNATADPDDRNLLTIEWMMRMGDGYRFRR